MITVTFMLILIFLHVPRVIVGASSHLRISTFVSSVTCAAGRAIPTLVVTDGMVITLLLLSSAAPSGAIAHHLREAILILRRPPRRGCVLRTSNTTPCVADCANATARGARRSRGVRRGRGARCARGPRRRRRSAGARDTMRGRRIGRAQPRGAPRELRPEAAWADWPRRERDTSAGWRHCALAPALQAATASREIRVKGTTRARPIAVAWLSLRLATLRRLRASST